jgi:hypothetical protein
MGRVGGEEAAAVGAELLDRDLGCGRSHRQELFRDRFVAGVRRGLKQRHGNIGPYQRTLLSF